MCLILKSKEAATKALYNKKRRKAPVEKAKIAIRARVKTAIRLGVLTKANCEVCGSEKSEAHHDDYNNPLEVRWLCRRHHSQWHKQHKAIEPVLPSSTITCVICGKEGVRYKHNSSTCSLLCRGKKSDRKRRALKRLTTPKKGHPKGEKHHGSKLTEEIVIRARKMFQDGMPINKIAKELGFNKHTIGDAVKKDTWKHIN